MAGSVNKVILIGNLGKDPEIRRTQDGRPIANLTRRHLGKLARQDHRRAQGKDRVAPRRDLQRGPVQDRRAIPQEGLEGLSRRRVCRRANGPTKTATTNIRPRSCCRASIRADHARHPRRRWRRRPPTAATISARAGRARARAAPAGHGRAPASRADMDDENSVLRPRGHRDEDVSRFRIGGRDMRAGLPLAAVSALRRHGHGLAAARSTPHRASRVVR